MDKVVERIFSQPRTNGEPLTGEVRERGLWCRCLGVRSLGAPKRLDRVRIIDDRRPEKSCKRKIDHVFFPYAPRLRHILLSPHQELRVEFRDIKDCFYVFGVSQTRLTELIIAPRIPREWLGDLGRVDLDEVIPSPRRTVDGGLSQSQTRTCHFGARTLPACSRRCDHGRSQCGLCGTPAAVRRGAQRRRSAHPRAAVPAVLHIRFGDVCIDDLFLIVEFSKTPLGGQEPADASCRPTPQESGQSFLWEIRQCNNGRSLGRRSCRRQSRDSGLSS